LSRFEALPVNFGAAAKSALAQASQPQARAVWSHLRPQTRLLMVDTNPESRAGRLGIHLSSHL